MINNQLYLLILFTYFKGSKKNKKQSDSEDDQSSSDIETQDVTKTPTESEIVTPLLPEIHTPPKTTKKAIETPSESAKQSEVEIPPTSEVEQFTTEPVAEKPQNSNGKCFVFIYKLFIYINNFFRKCSTIKQTSKPSTSC